MEYREKKWRFKRNTSSRTLTLNSSAVALWGQQGWVTGEGAGEGEECESAEELRGA